MSPRASSREALLDAAEAVVREKGAAHLTLDAVSAHARISKGGLLYHFRTKEDLLRAMLNRTIDFFVTTREAEAAKLPASPARELKAYIRARGTTLKGSLAATATALLAASAENPKLLQPIQNIRAKFIAQLSASRLPTAFVNAVCLAMDGLFILELLGVLPGSRRERQAVLDELLRLVDREEARLGDG